MQAKGIPILDTHELVAGKLAALFARSQPRDLFDAHSLFNSLELDLEKLRVAFIVYGGMNRIDWRQVSFANIDLDPYVLTSRLIPTLNTQIENHHPNAHEFGESLIKGCKEHSWKLFPFRENEMTFLDRLLDHGSIEPERLTQDITLQKRILSQPLLQWKALHVRKFKGHTGK